MTGYLVAEEVQVAEATRQQVPNPAAQLPPLVPPRSLHNRRWKIFLYRTEYLHSVEVTQVPVRPLVAVQASLGNWTTEKRPESGAGRGTAAARPRLSTGRANEYT